MSDNANTTNGKGKKRPDYIAFAVAPQRDNSGPKYTGIGVAFANKNGGYSVFYDAIPLGGHIVLVGVDDEKPAPVSYGEPVRKPNFEARMVREAGPNNAFWTEIGVAYRQDGYLSIFCDVVPTGGKIVLSAPREDA